MFCEKCGTEIAEGLAFCPNCGAPVAVPQAEPVAPVAAPQAEPVAPQPEFQQPQQPQFEQPQYQQPQYQQPQYQQPQYQQPYQQPAPAGEQKSKLAAGLLAIFVGTLGIHNFYLGKTGRAVAQLLISLLTLGFGAPVVAVWALIEGIFILTGHEGYTTDAKGIPLSD